MTGEPRDAGSLVAAFGALLVFVSLFLKWFDPGGSAWTVFEIIDLLLAALSVTTLALSGARWGLIRRSVWKLPLWVPGATAFVLVVSQLINHPPAAQGSHIETGAWIALVGTALMLAGGLLARGRVVITIRPSAAPVASGGPPSAPDPAPSAAPPVGEPPSAGSRQKEPERAVGRRRDPPS
jgi:hypothetical protein